MHQIVQRLGLHSLQIPVGSSQRTPDRLAGKGDGGKQGKRKGRKGKEEEGKGREDEWNGRYLLLNLSLATPLLPNSDPQYRFRDKRRCFFLSKIANFQHPVCFEPR